MTDAMIRRTAFALLGHITLSCGSEPQHSLKTQPPPVSSELDTCTCDDCEQHVEVQSALHTTAPYVGDGGAPAGGDHSACWGQWGVHQRALAPERLIHNLEHGGVAFLYNCPDGCPDERNWMERFVQTHPLTLLTQYEELDGRFAASAWGHRFQSHCFDPEGLAKFYSDHVDQGPERFELPPPGPPASCE